MPTPVDQRERRRGEGVGEARSPQQSCHHPSICPLSFHPLQWSFPPLGGYQQRAGIRRSWSSSYSPKMCFPQTLTASSGMISYLVDASNTLHCHGRPVCHSAQLWLDLETVSQNANLTCVPGTSAPARGRGKGEDLVAG